MLRTGTCCVNVNTTDATTGATALLLPAQNTHTLHDPIVVCTGTGIHMNVNTGVARTERDR